jgi:hypothetical protein
MIAMAITQAKMGRSMKKRDMDGDGYGRYDDDAGMATLSISGRA